jgi:hypothetical protein
MLGKKDKISSRKLINFSKYVYPRQKARKFSKQVFDPFPAFFRYTGSHNLTNFITAS